MCKYCTLLITTHAALRFCDFLALLSRMRFLSLQEDNTECQFGVNLCEKFMH